jgi:hypothetical protein
VLDRPSKNRGLSKIHPAGVFATRRNAVNGSRSGAMAPATNALAARQSRTDLHAAQRSLPCVVVEPNVRWCYSHFFSHHQFPLSLNLAALARGIRQIPRLEPRFKPFVRTCFCRPQIPLTALRHGSGGRLGRRNPTPRASVPQMSGRFSEMAPPHPSPHPRGSAASTIRSPPAMCRRARARCDAMSRMHGWRLGVQCRAAGRRHCYAHDAGVGNAGMRGVLHSQLRCIAADGGDGRPNTDKE